MMRLTGARNARQEKREYEALEPMASQVLQGAGLSEGKGRPAFLMRDRNEHGIAVFIGFFKEIALAAGGFHDLRAAIGLAFEEPRDLPRCRQHVWRSHRQFEAERVRIDEVNAFSDVHVAVVG